MVVAGRAMVRRSSSSTLHLIRCECERATPAVDRKSCTNSTERATAIPRRARGEERRPAQGVVSRTDQADHGILHQCCASRTSFFQLAIRFVESGPGRRIRAECIYQSSRGGSFAGQTGTTGTQIPPLGTPPSRPRRSRQSDLRRQPSGVYRNPYRRHLVVRSGDRRMQPEFTTRCGASRAEG
jgi:hypothetical protein